LPGKIAENVSGFFTIVGWRTTARDSADQLPTT
jgi:hypothetical protein